MNVVSKRVFVASPHRPHSAAVLGAINEALELSGPELGFSFEMLSPDNRRSSGQISEVLRDEIAIADLVIADVSGEMANVLWEIGFAQALGKPMILLAEDSGHIPFDIRDQRILLYQPSAPISNLSIRLAEAVLEVFESGSAPVRPSVSDAVSKRQKLFISYSHADRQFLDRILVHLRPLERKKLIEFWSDTNIKPGDRWKEEIRNALNEARTAVLLISADFLASEFIVTNELPPLLTAAEKNGARIIPLIVKPSRFMRDDSLSRFQALNDPQQPLIKMDEAQREDVYAKLAEIVELDLA